MAAMRRNMLMEAALAAAAGTKPTSFMGYQGGRPTEMAPGPAVQGLQAAVSQALAQQGVGPQVVSDRRARRGKDPRARERRRGRAEVYRQVGLPEGTDLRDLTADQRAALAEHHPHLLPRGGRDAGDLDFNGSEAPRVSVGSQLANIRWHGNPDGPVDDLGSLLDRRRRALQAQAVAARSA